MNIKLDLLFIALFFLLFLIDCSDSSAPSVKNNPPLSTAQKTYFKKIALGTEFLSEEKKIAKWINNIVIYVEGEANDILEQELNAIIIELNKLIPNLNIKRTRKKAEANFIVYFGHGKDYANTIESKAKNYMDSNWGFVYVYWNDNYEIYKGSMYVDVFRAKKVAIQKHLLREELTQGLGLLNDAEDYEDSIFQQQWTSVTTYSTLDKVVIQTLYHPAIKTGMTYSEVETVLNDKPQIPNPKSQ